MEPKITKLKLKLKQTLLDRCLVLYTSSSSISIFLHSPIDYKYKGFRQSKISFLTYFYILITTTTISTNTFTFKTTMDSIKNEITKQVGTHALNSQISSLTGGNKSGTDGNNNVTGQEKYINQGVEYVRKNGFGDNDITDADRKTDAQISSAINAGINNFKK